MSVEEKLLKVRERLLKACVRAGRAPESVRLIAVSKKQDVSAVRGAFNAGQNLFGENYVQELVPKAEQLENLPVEWHFIGPLQSNKVRKIIGKVELIHSVDRESLLQEISRQAELHHLRQKILIQVNVSGESSKSGLAPSEVSAFMERAARLPGIEVRGLMTMPPLVEATDGNRGYFRSLKKLFDDIQTGSLFELSMGTSQDFETAIEEGATLIRVGTEIFGSRKDEA